MNHWGNVGVGKMSRGQWNRYMKAVAGAISSVCVGGAYGIFGVPYLY